MSEFELDALEIVREVDPSRLVWAEGGGGTVRIRDALDLRGISWAEARQTLGVEEAALARLQGWLARADAEDAVVRAAGREALLLALEERAYEAEGFLGETQLDLGVASAVAALSALGCVPAMSCRGGPGHQEFYPQVIFGARAGQVPALLRAAEAAGCGLTNLEGGLEVCARDIRQIVAFARALIGEHHQARPIRDGS